MCVFHIQSVFSGLVGDPLCHNKQYEQNKLINKTVRVNVGIKSPDNVVCNKVASVSVTVDVSVNRRENVVS